MNIESYLNDLFKYQMASRFGKRVPRKLKKKFTITNKIEWKRLGVDSIIPRQPKPASTPEEYLKRKNESESYSQFIDSIIKNISKNIGIPIEYLTKDF